MPPSPQPPAPNPESRTPSPEPRTPSPEPRARGPERRTIGPELAAARVEARDDQPGRIVGYGAVFYDGTEATEYELWEGTRERILPGAFDRAIREDDVRALMNHDVNLVLGRNKAGSLRLAADARGLRYEIDPADTQAGRDAAALVARGDISGSSFSFVVTDEQWRVEDEIRIREIRGVRLFDVGPVTFPAYEATTAGLRAEGDPTEARESLDRWLAQRRAREAEGMDMDVRVAEVSRDPT
ncbi:MAG: HK97 family phage prohead protease [Pirellulales bacterium]|nr:HK97 family phage prohead protease [Pirellulales bacterium]